MITTLIIVSLLFLALIGTPLFIIMLLISMICFSMQGISISTVPIAMYQIASQPMMLSIPLFTFAGYLLAESNSPTRILRLGKALFGWIPGGIAIVALIVSAIFTAFTGASGVTIIALGGLLFPILKEEGYSEEFCLGLITTCGSLGLLFPPSLPLILYGLISKTDIDQLFRAGPLPGVFLIGVLSLYAIWVKRKNSKDKKLNQKMFQPFNLKEAFYAIKGAFFELLLPIGILVGIYGGITTVSEAAAITALYVFVMTTLIYKDVSLKKIGSVVEGSMSLVGAILLMVSCALALTNYLVDEEVPMKLLEFIQSAITSKFVFLMVLNIFLVLVGCMMDIFSATVIVVPLITPMAIQYGVHPIHLAIIFLTNLEIGYLTPPVGINLFISSFRFQKHITYMYKVVIPFILLLWFSLILLTYIPELSLFFIK